VLFFRQAFGRSSNRNLHRPTRRLPPRARLKSKGPVIMAEERNSQNFLTDPA
jgi:hypothetical protein